MRQKCLIRGRRLLSSEDTSKASSKTTFYNFRLSTTAIFASGIASASALFASGILVFNSLNISKDFLTNYPVYSQIFKENGPKIMKTIAGDLTAKLCETIPSFTELSNVGDGCNYVARPSLEKIILQASEQSLKNKGGVWTIVVGPNGAGKSSAVARVLRGKKGVVALMVSDRDTRESVILRLVELCGIDVKGGVSIDLGEFGPVLLKAAEMRKGLPITIVFEVERTSTSLDVLPLIKKVAKYFAVFASVIIVLSEANAGLAFGDDERHKIVWVDEMSAEEAEKYAKKLHPAVSDAELKLIFDKVGKLPLKILRSMTALKEGISAAEIIEEAVAAADADLVAFPLEPILTALKATPDGVHIRAFDGVKYKGVNLAQPKDVAVAMKMTNCIVYHIPSKQYRLVSRAHRTALMQYKPPKGMFGW